MEARFVGIKMKELFALATMVDPRSKHVYYATNVEKQWARTALESTVENNALVHHTVDSIMLVEDDTAEPSVWTSSGGYCVHQGSLLRVPLRRQTYKLRST